MNSISQKRNLTSDKNLNFCRIVVDFIKNRIGVDNDNFIKYLDYIKKNHIDSSKILRIILSEKVLTNLIKKANTENIRYGRYERYSIKDQARKILLIISLALIESPDYQSLKEDLKKLTNLGEKSVRNAIIEYIPLLKILNPSLNIDKWLPRKKMDKYNYTDVKKLVQNAGLNKTTKIGVLLKPENEDEFKELLKNYRSSEIPLIVKCGACGYIWTTDVHAMQRKFWCDQCARKNKKLSKNDLETIASEKSLRLLSNYEDDYKDRLSLLKWRCKKCGTFFESNTSNVNRAKCPCPYCYKPYQLIVWDKQFENILKNNIKFIVSNLPFNEDLEELKEYFIEKSLELWEKLLENGFEPKYMGVDKNSISLSFCIIYFILLIHGVKQIGDQPISVKAIFNSLGNNTKNLNLVKETQFHAAPSKLYKFLPDEYKKVFDEHAKFFKLSYKRVKRFIEKVLKAKLITTEKEFNRNKEKDNTSPVHTKIEISCNRGHIWSTTYNYLKWHGSWCPDCAQGRYERIIRWYFEKIFSSISNSEIIFPNTKLSNVINSIYENDIVSSFISYSHFDGYTELPNFKEFDIKVQNANVNFNNSYKKNYKISVLNNENLQKLFDEIICDYLIRDILIENDYILIEFPFGYIELLFLNGEVKLIRSELKSYKVNVVSNSHTKFAFEYNGLHHYIYPNYYHSNFKQFLSRICNDLLKKKISKDNNIVLIEIPYWISPDMNSPKRIRNYIIKEFKIKANIDLNSYNLPNFNHITQGFYLYESNNIYKDLTEF